MDSSDFFSVYNGKLKISDYIDTMNKLCQEYGKEIISSHHAIGNPVYYEDSAFPNLIVKKMPDGSKYLIEPLPNKKDHIIKNYNGKIELPEPPLQDFANLRQAVEWIAYGLKPIPLAYDKALRGKIRNIQTTTKQELKDAKKVLFIALYENKIVAYGNKGINSQTDELIPNLFWDFENISWNENYVFMPNIATYSNIKINTEELFKLFAYQPEDIRIHNITLTERKIHSLYTTPYIELMEEAIKEFKIDYTNQVMIKILVKWFNKKLIGLKGEMNPSINKAKMLATFVRLPQAQKGGNVKSKTKKFG